MTQSPEPQNRNVQPEPLTEYELRYMQYVQGHTKHERKAAQEIRRLRARVALAEAAVEAAIGEHQCLACEKQKPCSFGRALSKWREGPK